MKRRKEERATELTFREEPTLSRGRVQVMVKGPCNFVCPSLSRDLLTVQGSTIHRRLSEFAKHPILGRPHDGDICISLCLIGNMGPFLDRTVVQTVVMTVTEMMTEIEVSGWNSKFGLTLQTGDMKCHPGN